MNLSIVVIAKDEEFVIEKCIKSIIAGCNKNYAKNDFEIILVDSMSSDSTVEKAQKTLELYNVANWLIIKHKSTRFTAALSREIGRNYSSGDNVLFLDGDMVLYSDFLLNMRRTEQFLENDIVGLVGHRIDAYYDGNFRLNKLKRISREIDKKKFTVNPGGGVFFMINHMKGIHYNIEQKTREEESLAKKLLAQAKKIKYIDENMYLHLNYKRTKRGLVEKVNMVKEGSYDYVNALRIHKSDYGLLSMVRNYYKYLTNYILVPILLFISLSIFYINNYNISFVLVFFISTLYLVGAKLQSLNTIFFLMGLLKKKREIPIYDVVEVIKSN